MEESEGDSEQRLNILQAGVLHTGSKPWSGGQTPLLCSGAVWATTGTPVYPRAGTWLCLAAAVMTATRTEMGESPEPLFC